MAAPSIVFEAPVSAPGLLPSRSRPIDLVHLAALTSGDKGREIEALQAFVRQARQTVREMAAGERTAIAAAARRLANVATGVGAFKVAEAAARLEETGGEAADVARLGAAVLESENFVLKLSR